MARKTKAKKQKKQKLPSEILFVKKSLDTLIMSPLKVFQSIECLCKCTTLSGRHFLSINLQRGTL